MYASSWLAVLIGLSLFMSTATSGFSQTRGSVRRQAATELYPKLSLRLQNPLARVLVLPTVVDYARGAGSTGNGEEFSVRFAPRVPISLTTNWHMISISDIAWVQQKNLVQGRTQGVTDLSQTFLLSPGRSLGKGLYWGVGPSFIFPTASNDLLGSRPFSVGPSLGIFRQQKPWTVGLMLNHLWPATDSDDVGAVSVTSLRPAVAYTTSTSTSLILQSRSSYVWTNDEWIVPIEFGLRQLTLIANRPVQWGVEFRYYVDPGVATPDWGVGVRISFPFEAPGWFKRE